ncbi:leucyl aminopeptidase [Acidocella aminolytica]|jgi:leucyl aminopeptidase|uniref:Probable cytosol aminopeptidase n=1 Tax=Acidocella aminolytica 101 = DSM 11237 TaxID=1120923 RepID=A0A0D6PF81_9PROT|nr:leucyl aminopeptidase [Acidocella aminolytica]GAN80322.1 leucyl aminopeptidase [Acidocella aminolytica 101 = DSM 11237]GBQ33384.1 leucyl/cytosol aminopeptidase [Acidocella aminolytica 101 = DSM 11237]SHF49115.1 leucyl aminopeptidase [Acidocella aminolytica 101 = DSM 11237]
MVEILFGKLALPKEGVLVLPVGEDLPLTGEAAMLDESLEGALSNAMQAAEFKGKAGQNLNIYGVRPYKRVLLVGAGKEDAPRRAELLGAAIASSLSKEKEAAILTHGFTAKQAAEIGLGARLRSYKFDKYRTTQKPDEKAKLKKLTFLTGAPKDAEAAWESAGAVATGVEFTRDLVTEPANELYPAEFAERLEGLKKLGLKIEVFGQKELEKLGFGALLSVSQGSVHEPRMVVMQWLGASGNGDKKGAKKPKDPLVFVGKGVTFDTGGISLKPAAGMEDMKWDMAGAGTVSGLMAALAGRKAKVDAVGLVGLVENMPSGSATRPGDVVKSYAGKTVEILNTDAEGRLVLADVLYYAQEQFAPKFMVNLATLTGAIIVGLGHEYAGLFSNNDELVSKLVESGNAVGEKLWRMPLAKEGEAYDKELDSAIADVKNIGGGRAGGSITAAQFLQRFVNTTPWAHLDIAGMAWGTKDAGVNPKGATAFGVRLLDNFARGFEG